MADTGLSQEAVDFFENYNKSSDIVSFTEAINNIVEWFFRTLCVLKNVSFVI